MRWLVSRPLSVCLVGVAGGARPCRASMAAGTSAHRGVRHASRRARNAELARLGRKRGPDLRLDGGAQGVRLGRAAEALDRERELRTAEDIAASLGR